MDYPPQLQSALGLAVLVVDNKAYHWLRGEDHAANWKKPHADWHAWFCRVCGSVLPGANDPARMAVPAALILEGGENLKGLAGEFQLHPSFAREGTRVRYQP